MSKASAVPKVLQNTVQKICPWSRNRLKQEKHSGKNKELHTIRNAASNTSNTCEKSSI